MAMGAIGCYLLPVGMAAEPDGLVVCTAVITMQATDVTTYASHVFM